MVDLTHRLEGYDNTAPDSSSLSDSIYSASGRASAIITMLQGDFVDGMNELTNETVYSALEAIRLECLDMRKTVEHFDAAQKSPS